MAKKLFSNDALAVFESSDGAVYVAETQPFVKTEEKNEIVRQIRDALSAISPEALRLARAYVAIGNYTSTEMRQACAKIRSKGESATCYALVDDCTPNNGTIVAISNDAAELIDLHTSDIMRAIVLDDTSVSVGDRIAIDWDCSQVNLADCL